MRRAPKDYGKVLSEHPLPDSQPQGVLRTLPPKRAPKHFSKTSIKLLHPDFLTLVFGFVLISLIASRVASRRRSGPGREGQVFVDINTIHCDSFSVQIEVIRSHSEISNALCGMLSNPHRIYSNV
jgi:hypothetical protein